MTVRFKVSVEASDAIRQLSISSIDHSIVNKLSGYETLLRSLDNWILVPDYDLLPELEKLAAVVKQLYKHKTPLTIYRGFSLNKGPYQNTTLPTEGWLIKSVTVPIGVTHDLSLKGPMSFSSSKDIAEAFGEYLIECTIPDIRTVHGLVITPELSYLVAKRRNLVRNGTFEDQAEIIMFPNQVIRVKRIK